MTILIVLICLLFLLVWAALIAGAGMDKIMGLK